MEKKALLSDQNQGSEVKVGQVWENPPNGQQWKVVFMGEVVCTIREMKYAYGDRVTTVPQKYIIDNWKLIKDVPNEP